MTGDPHAGFVLAAYAVGFIVIAAMAGAILRDYASLKKQLARFPGRGERDADSPR